METSRGDIYVTREADEKAWILTANTERGAVFILDRLKPADGLALQVPIRLPVKEADEVCRAAAHKALCRDSKCVTNARPEQKRNREWFSASRNCDQSSS